MSCYTSTVSNYSAYTSHVLEPGGNARQTRRLLAQANEAAAQEGFYSRHVKPIGYAGIAWINTIFDVTSFGTKYLRECTICIVECNYEELLATTRETGWDLFCSVKLAIALPVAVALHVFQSLCTCISMPSPFAFTNYAIDTRERQIEILQRQLADTEQQLTNLRNSQIEFCRESTLMTHNIFTDHTADEFPPSNAVNVLESHQELLRTHIRRLLDRLERE